MKRILKSFAALLIAISIIGAPIASADPINDLWKLVGTTLRPLNALWSIGASTARIAGISYFTTINATSIVGPGMSLQSAYNGGPAIVNTIANPVSITGVSASDNTLVIPVGQVGIGTATPTYKLEVVDNSGVTLGEHQVATIHDGSAAGLILGYLADGAAKTSGFLRSFAGFDLTIGAGATYSDAFFIDKDNGNIGIGTTSPAFALNIVSDSAHISIDRYSNSANGPGYVGRHARGTILAPTATQTDDALTTIGGRGYGATGFSATTRAHLDFRAAENWTDVSQGGYISFNTTAIGSTTNTERARMYDTGDTFWTDGSYYHSGFVNNFSGGFVPVPFDGLLTKDSAGTPIGIFGRGDVGAGSFVEVDVTAMTGIGSIGAIKTVADVNGDDVASMNTFDGFVLGSPTVDTSSGKRIAIDDGTGNWRFEVDGATGDIVTIGALDVGTDVNIGGDIDTVVNITATGDYLGADINHTSVAPNDIGTTGQTSFYGDGSNLTNLPQIFFDATVSSSAGADYPTFSAAVAAGARRLYLYDTVTETANTVLTLGNYNIYVEKGTGWSFGDFVVTAGGLSNVDITGYGQISWANTTGTPLWSPTANTNMHVERVNLQNNSTLAGSVFATATTCQTINDVDLSVPNLTGLNGITVAANGCNNSVENLTLTGNGASSAGGLSLGAGQATNIVLSDTWSTSTANPAIIIGDRGQLTNLIARTSSEAKIEMGSGELTNYISHGAAHPDIFITASGAILQGGDMGDGYLDTQGFNSARISDYSSDGLLDLSDAAGGSNYVVNSKFDTNSVIESSGNQFVNYNTDGTLDISGNDNSWDGGRIGDIFSITGGGGAVRNHFNGISFDGGGTNTIGGQRNSVSNSTFTNALNITDNGNMVDSSEIGGASTITGDKTRISNSRYTANSATALSFSSSDENSVTGTQIGQDAGGGIGTITFGAGSARNIATGNHTDAAIVDNNGDLSAANNVTY